MFHLSLWKDCLDKKPWQSQGRATMIENRLPVFQGRFRDGYDAEILSPLWGSCPALGLGSTFPDTKLLDFEGL